MITLKLLLCRLAIGLGSCLAWGWAIGQLWAGPAFLGIAIRIAGGMALGDIWVDSQYRTKGKQQSG